jgi:hypothetical protein
MDKVKLLETVKQLENNLDKLDELKKELEETAERSWLNVTDSFGIPDSDGKVSGSHDAAYAVLSAYVTGDISTEKAIKQLEEIAKNAV